MNNWTRYIENGKMGIMDECSGAVILPAHYDIIKYDFRNEEGILCACKDGLWALIKADGEELTGFKYQDIQYCSKKLNVVFYNKLYGYINRWGVEVTPLRFDYADFENAAHQAIVSINHRFGVINDEGFEIIPCIFDSIEGFQVGELYYYIAHKNDNSLFYDSHGLRLERKIYRGDRIRISLGANLYIAQANGLCGIVDERGVELVPCFYSAISRIGYGNNSYFAASVNGKWGYIDLMGTVIAPFIFDKARWFCCGLAPVQIGDKWGFINTQGDVIIKPKYDDVGEHFEHGFIKAKYNGLWGVIDTSGKQIIPFKHPKISVRSLDPSAFSWEDPSCCSVSNGSKVGMISSDGRLLVPMEYEDVKFTKGHIALVKKSHLWGFYDLIEGEFLSSRYTSIGMNFNNGVAVVTETTGSKALIDREGRTFLRADSILYVTIDAFIVNRNGHWGIVNKRDETLYPFEIDMIQTLPSDSQMFDRKSIGSFFAKKGEKWAVFSDGGERLSGYDYSLSTSTERGICLRSSPIFYDGIARVRKGEFEGFIDTKGNYAVDTVWKNQVYLPSLRKNADERFYTIYFTDWNGMKKRYRTLAHSKAEAENNWYNSGVQFGASIDSIE